MNHQVKMEELSPFHQGELAVQEREGVREFVESWAHRAIRPFLPQQHRDFFERLPFVIAAVRDEQERPWLTMLAGTPGFIRSPEEASLLIRAETPRGDALERAIKPGVEVGLLGIELHTRRRNRANGLIWKQNEEGLHFAVSQSFGNCPKYISRREWRHVSVPEASMRTSTHKKLTTSLQEWITSADTFFIASGYRGEGESSAYGLDASHRGGPSGFVKVIDDTQLLFPDYAGNRLFNTIGNLMVDPRVGMLFVDFASGSLLQLTGLASIDWDSEAISEHPGAQRLVSIRIEAAVHLEGALPLRWDVPTEPTKYPSPGEKKRKR